MKKTLKAITFCAGLTALVLSVGLLRDRQMLGSQLIRLHVVANSDTENDQAVKLLVRDAIVENLTQQMQDATDPEQAKAYLQEQLPKLQELANDTLAAAGSMHKAVVTLAKEAFPLREYDTFSLPSGVYESLRIVIGEGQGHNWWCVVFPQLCLPAVSDGVYDAAAEVGFSDNLTDALTKPETSVRFYLLDRLGELENFLFESRETPFPSEDNMI